MMPPGRNPATFNQSAATRFSNDQMKAKQMGVAFNPAAQQAFKPKSAAPAAPSGPPVGEVNAQSFNPVRGLEPPAPIALPTGGPQFQQPPQPLADFDAGAFKENAINELVGQVRLRHFLGDPQVKDATTIVNLNKYFNSTNPNAFPDTRNLLDRVLERLGKPNG